MVSNFNWDEVSDTEEESRVFVTFNELEDNKVTVTFEDEAPKNTKGKYGDNVMFKVITLDDEGEEMKAYFTTSSKRCLRELKKHRPLANKALEITKVGTEFETQYEIVEV